jgi:tetratricopeptide (TPR) repeat protein
LLSELGRPTEALEVLKRSIAVREPLFRENPGVALYRGDLARSQSAIGSALVKAGQHSDALASLERARVAFEAMARDNPDLTYVGDDLAACHTSIGDALRATGRLDEALAAYERAMAIREPLAGANPDFVQYQLELSRDLKLRGVTQQASGRSAEAVASYRRAIAILDRLRPASAAGLYELACCHARLSTAAGPGSGLSGAEGRAEAERAIIALRKAVDSGYSNVVEVRDGADLEPLRSRPDFRTLIRDVVFPADPFARTERAPRSSPASPSP